QAPRGPITRAAGAGRGSSAASARPAGLANCGGRMSGDPSRHFAFADALDACADALDAYRQCQAHETAQLVEQRYGELWEAGRPPAEAVDAYAIVELWDCLMPVNPAAWRDPTASIHLPNLSELDAVRLDVMAKSLRRKARALERALGG